MVTHIRGSETAAAAQSVAVIGGGAIGGVFASALHTAGHDVLMCVRSPLDELVIETAAGERHIPARIVTDPAGLAPVDWVFLAVKAHDTESVAPWLDVLCDEGTTVVILQNGIDQVERLRRLVPDAVLLPSLVYIAAERTAPGHIRCGYEGRVVVPAGAAAAGLMALLRNSGLEIQQDEEFTEAAWRKLLVNVAANPITALTMRRMDVFTDPELRELALGLMRETAAVGAAAGAHLTEQDARNALDFFEEFTAGNGTSMLYDRLTGHRLEYEALNGVVVRTAERHGIDVPLNRSILALLRSLEPLGAAS